MALRKRLNKKGGCEYANVSDNYNLLEDAIKQIKGGNKNNRKGGCTSFADVNSSYMITETKTGGNRSRKGGDLWSTGKDIFNKFPIIAQQSPSQPVAPVASPVAPVAPVVATEAETKGGNRRGGCRCSASQSMRKGGAIELAPFAAAVALMAARYMTDMDIIEPMGSRKSSTKSPVKKTTKTPVKKTIRHKTY